MYRFGPFQLDPQAHELRRSGIRVKVREQPFVVLLKLLECPGELVTREELRSVIWPADTFVDFDTGLNTVIKRLREVLRDSTEVPLFIETVPKLGYRFIAPVECLDGERARTAASLGKKGISATVKWTVAASIVLVVAASGAYFLTRTLPPPKVVGSMQITNDAFPKTAVATDGARLYFTEMMSSRQFIAEVATTGGDSAQIPLSFPNATLFAMSPSRSDLLMGSQTSTELDSPLWIVPLPAGPPRRIGDIEAHDATYSPDGTEIIYAKGSDLYRARTDGTESQKLVSLPSTSTAYYPRFSPDGMRLRFTLVENGLSSLWESTGNGANPHPLLTGQNERSQECCGDWTEDGRFFVFLKGAPAVHALSSDVPNAPSAATNVWALGETTGLFRKVSRVPVQLTTGPLAFGRPVPSKDGKKIFVGGGQLRAELTKYDSKSRQFVPYLSGISAGQTDFSRDNRWWAYVTYPDGILWRSRLDGTDRLQLTYPPLIATVPRWSPDGKYLVFVGYGLKKRFGKILMVPTDGGQAQELLPQDHADEDDPTWSPDGKSILFAHYPSFASGLSKANIRILNLATHAVAELPGSEGMLAPRWSPDGRYVCALSSDVRKMKLYTVSTQKWQELAEGLFHFLDWSRDGRYVYTENSALKEPAIVRVRIANHKVEQIAPLKGVRRVVAAGDLWSGITPDGSPLTYAFKQTGHNASNEQENAGYLRHGSQRTVRISSPMGTSLL